MSFLTPEEKQRLTVKDREFYTIELLEKIAYLLEGIGKNLGSVKPQAETIEFKVYSTNNDGSNEKEISDMKLQLGKDALVKVKGFKDASGNPAQVDGGKCEFTLKGDLTLGSLKVSEDGLSARFVRNGVVGKVTVQLSADADLGPDQKLIVGEVEIDCLGGEAVMIELDASEVDPEVAPPVEEPAAPVEAIV